MFGGLTKTSSRIAIAAALGLTLGGFAFTATPVQAADLGGDCCADLEERVAELEATTVRKGNKKVSVTISGWVVKAMNFWDDGDIDSFYVGDKPDDLASRFAITGSATISPGWSAGYNLTVTTPASVFGFGSNQFDEEGASPIRFISTLYSYIYIKSDTFGAINWGYLSPASDNPAVLADISGTVIESNGVWFEGNSMFLRPKGAQGGQGGLSSLTWGSFLQCQGIAAGIGVDCFGSPQPAVRYDSPTWGGFRFETSYGTYSTQAAGVIPTPDANFWDIAAFYTADWNSIKVSAAYAYTWMESAINSGSFTRGFCADRFRVEALGGGFFNLENAPDECFGDNDTLEDGQLHQFGGSIMHKPSGVGIYGMYQHEEAGGGSRNLVGVTGFVPVLAPIGFVPKQVFFNIGTPDTDAWYIKPFIRRAFSPIGHTVLYGEWGQYNDQFSGNLGNLCPGFDRLGGTSLDNFCDTFRLTVAPNLQPIALRQATAAFVTGSEAERWGLGVVQEIDSAAMHVWARWQHQELDVDITGFVQEAEIVAPGVFDARVKRQRVNQSFDDWDLFQIGGVIFF